MNTTTSFFRRITLKTILPIVATNTASIGAAADTSGWQEIPLAGETRCADGSPYSIFVNQGTSGKLVLDFMGGGACWSPETCKDGAPHAFKKVPDVIGSWLPEADGIYDRTNPKNPFRDDTHVMIPYCTGDIHWGNADVTYVRDNGEKIDILHRGAVNAKAALDFALTNVSQDPSQIFVTGCSAGAYGSIWWTPYVKQHNPAAKIIQFGDSGAGIFTEDFRDHGLPNWNIESSAPRWIPELNPDENNLMRLKSHDIYNAVAKAYPDIRLTQYNTMNDILQRWFFAAMGGNHFTWTAQMRASLGLISMASPNFNYFIAPWDAHCILPYKSFYGDEKAQSRALFFPNWLKSMLSGTPEGNEPCEGCIEE